MCLCCDEPKTKCKCEKCDYCGERPECVCNEHNECACLFCQAPDCDKAVGELDEDADYCDECWKKEKYADQ